MRSGVPGVRRAPASAALVLVAAACAGPGGSDPGATPSVARTPGTVLSASAPTHAVTPDLAVRPLAPGVWLHTTWQLFSGTRVPSHGLVVEDGDGLLLVDSAWGDEATRELVTWLERETGRRVTRMLATHHHEDRLSASGWLQGRGVEVLAHPLTPALARAAGVAEPAPLEGLAERGSAVRMGPVEVFYPGPGHAVDNLVVWLPSARILFGGCAVRPAGSASLGNTADADVAHWPRAIERVRDAYGARAALVIPGHGDPTDAGVLDHTIGLFGGR